MTPEERIANLETRIENLQDAHELLTRQLAEARLDQWQGRIDDLELQVHLGAREAGDRLTALTTELDATWRKVRQQVSIAGSTATDVAEALRGGLQSAYQDLREALIESRKQLT